MQRWLVALGLLVACSDRTLTVPLEDGDRSLVLLSAGASTALACDVDDGCPEIDLGHDDWDVLVLVYPETLDAMGFEGGAIPLVEPGASGERFPVPERAFAASKDEPELSVTNAVDAPLYRESLYDPSRDCPSWSEIWASPPGNRSRVAGVIEVDADTALVFTNAGEVVRIQGRRLPEIIGTVPAIRSAVRGGDGEIYALGTDQRVHRISSDGRATLVDTIPALPFPFDDEIERATIAVTAQDALHVQLVTDTEPTHTSTVWSFDGTSWAISASTGATGRVQQNLLPEILVEGIRGEAFTSELPEGPLVRVTATGERRPVPDLSSVDQVNQLRRLSDGRILVVSRITPQGRVQLASVAASGELVIEETFVLPESPDWLCSEAARGGVFCSASDGFTRFLGGPPGCEDASPPTFKGQRWIVPVADGWLVQTYDQGNVDSLHRVALE